MHDQILAFIAALRAAGVRISLAESVDALRAVEQAGFDERALFRAALQATLVKEHADLPTFQRLFPLYFGGGGAAFIQLSGDDALSAAEQAELGQALSDLLSTAEQPGLAQLFQAVVEGRPLGHDQLLGLLPRPAPSGLSHPMLQRWAARQALRDLQLERLDDLLLALLAQLRAAGMGEAALESIAQRVRANQAAQAEQLSQAVLRQLQRQAGGERPRTQPRDELLERPFHLLSAQEAEELRGAVARLAAQVRTRASQRRHRARRGALDPRGT
ncbi:MAG: CoxE, partial [Chloroflexales bacterium]|nr:CoxE [Chloroflexales bacterium]